MSPVSFSSSAGSITAPVRSIPSMVKSPAGICESSVTGCREPSRMRRPSHRITHSAISRCDAACAHATATAKATIVRNINPPTGPAPETRARRCYFEMSSISSAPAAIRDPHGSEGACRTAPRSHRRGRAPSPTPCRSRNRRSGNCRFPDRATSIWPSHLGAKNA